MARFVVHPLAEDDIAEVLAYTLERFGLAQYRRYEEAIEEALTALVERPDLGRPLPGRPGFFLHSIARRGRRASHQFLYRVVEGPQIQVLRLLHDAMDPPRHLPK